MEKNHYKRKQREMLANMIKKLKNENEIDSNEDTDLNRNIIPKKPKFKKHHKKKNLNLNDNLNKEIHGIDPQAYQNYEKCKYKIIYIYNYKYSN
jgi:hypothetical protein